MGQKSCKRARNRSPPQLQRLSAPALSFNLPKTSKIVEEHQKTAQLFIAGSGRDPEYTADVVKHEPAWLGLHNAQKGLPCPLTIWNSGTVDNQGRAISIVAFVRNCHGQLITPALKRPIHLRINEDIKVYDKLPSVRTPHDLPMTGRRPTRLACSGHPMPATNASGVSGRSQGTSDRRAKQLSQTLEMMCAGSPEGGAPPQNDDPDTEFSSAEEYGDDADGDDTNNGDIDNDVIETDMAFWRKAGVVMVGDAARIAALLKSRFEMVEQIPCKNLDRRCIELLIKNRKSVFPYNKRGKDGAIIRLCKEKPAFWPRCPEGRTVRYFGTDIRCKWERLELLSHMFLLPLNQTDEYCAILKGKYGVSYTSWEEYLNKILEQPDCWLGDRAKTKGGNRDELGRHGARLETVKELVRVAAQVERHVRGETEKTHLIAYQATPEDLSLTARKVADRARKKAKTVKTQLAAPDTPASIVDKGDNMDRSETASTMSMTGEASLAKKRSDKSVQFQSSTTNFHDSVPEHDSNMAFEDEYQTHTSLEPVAFPSSSTSGPALASSQSSYADQAMITAPIPLAAQPSKRWKGFNQFSYEPANEPDQPSRTGNVLPVSVVGNTGFLNTSFPPFATPKCAARHFGRSVSTDPPSGISSIYPNRGPAVNECMPPTLRTMHGSYEPAMDYSSYMSQPLPLDDGHVYGSALTQTQSLSLQPSFNSGSISSSSSYQYYHLDTGFEHHVPKLTQDAALAALGYGDPLPDGTPSTYENGAPRGNFRAKHHG